MAKYRALFKNNRLMSVEQTNEDTPANDTFLEENTGSLVWAIIDAGSEDEAQEKALRVETELQTGLTKKMLDDKENAPG